MLGALLLGGVLAGDAAVHQAVGRGAGAQTTRAVDAAHRFARCIQAGDDLQVHVDDAALEVGFHASHAVVHLRPQAHAVERRLVDGLGVVGDWLLEVLVQLVRHVL